MEIKTREDTLQNKEAQIRRKKNEFKSQLKELESRKDVVIEKEKDLYYREHEFNNLIQQYHEREIDLENQNIELKDLLDEAIVKIKTLVIFGMDLFLF